MIQYISSKPKFALLLAMVSMPLLAVAGDGDAVATENLGLAVLPAPGPVVVDGNVDDWNLAGGIFICGDVFKQRDTYALWLHAMYDQEHLYLLARWRDSTPLNNPRQTIADHGWYGDSLQFRLRAKGGTQDERISHWTCWRGKDGADTAEIQYGRDFLGGYVRNGKEDGVKQAFRIDADGSGYTQEIAIPWRLVTTGGKSLKPGDPFQIGVEANFCFALNTNTGAEPGRLTIKDNFQPGIVPDRSFTMQKFEEWGAAKIMEKAPTAPAPLRLVGGKVLPVSLVNGIPVVDWSPLEVGRTAAEAAPSVAEIPYEMPAKGKISMIVRDASGQIVRHLLNAEPREAGRHKAGWDGLTTPNWDRPGTPVAPGDYTVSALYVPDFTIALRGWAGSAASVPWQAGPDSDWGGDHGPPTACAANGKSVVLGWANSESGRPLVACDLQGKIRWRKKFAGGSGVKALAVDGEVVYVLGGDSGGDEIDGSTLYRLDANNGNYLTWGNGRAALAMSELLPAAPADQGKQESSRATAVAAANGSVFLSFREAGTVVQIDGTTGKKITSFAIPAPVLLAASGDKTLYVLSGGKMSVPVSEYFKHLKIQGSDKLLALDLKTGRAQEVPVKDLSNARGLAVDGQGQLYVALGEPGNQVLVLDPKGQRLRTIGRAGGRPLLGPWDLTGMRFVSSLAVDGAGTLWVAESDDFPRRFSSWDSTTGDFRAEFFGPTGYGAIGGAIDPTNPSIMAGMGCEWELDPKTGRARVIGVVTRDGMQNTAYVAGSNKKLYLVTSTEWCSGSINIFERIRPGEYRQRAAFDFEGARLSGEHPKPLDAAGKPIPPKTRYWADLNGDGQRQPEEVTEIGEVLEFNPWHLYVGPDFSFYSRTSGGENAAAAGKGKRFALRGFAESGAPLFDLANPQILPVQGMGSADGRVTLKVGGDWAKVYSWYEAYDNASGKLLWRYPNNFVGVHGSHSAPPFPRPGLFRGSFGPLAALSLPQPIGNAWVFTSNLGEWHVLTQEGFYLTPIFDGNYTGWHWPEKAVPGADMTHCPPGGGGEDFGGNIVLAKDGRVYAQGGFNAFWNVEIKGWEGVRRLPDQKVTITPEDMKRAGRIQEQLAQKAVLAPSYALKCLTPVFTGDVQKDFKDANLLRFEKNAETAVTAVATWDSERLYLGWRVSDSTPWKNGADAPEFLYARGDTVDFQMGTNPNAKEDRNQAEEGDLRLSIGSFHEKPTVVLYRRVSKDKKPKTFSSGIATEAMDWVGVLETADVKIRTLPNAYEIEASIPWSALGMTPAPGLVLQGDFGVTHGSPAGDDTVLRSYWHNQHTGIVSDEVFELKMEPKYWGKLEFKQ